MHNLKSSKQNNYLLYLYNHYDITSIMRKCNADDINVIQNCRIKVISLISFSFSMSFKLYMYMYVSYKYMDCYTKYF